MDNGGDFVIIDVRDELKFKKEHIAGATNIPDARGSARYQGVMDEKLRALPDTKIKVFYCD